MNVRKTVWQGVLLLLLAFPGLAQKGTGAVEGIASSAEKPAIETLTGELLEIKIGPCKHTTGKSMIGSHLLLRQGKKTLNIHLGPEQAVAHVVEQLSPGMALSVEAFQTTRLTDDAYIAKVLLLEDQRIQLRDDNLRPSWADSERPRGQSRQGSSCCMAE